MEKKIDKIPQAAGPVPVLGEQDATDPPGEDREIGEGDPLTCGQAVPKIFETYNLLRLCVSAEIRD
jgi:hypothetical protein